jgi:hypothetical protein
MRQITREDLDRLVEVYKNGIDKWFRDELFTKDCAYYEGAIKKGSEVLGIEVPFTFLQITEDLKKDFESGYNNFWIG